MSQNVDQSSEGKTEIFLSEIELQEIFQNPDYSYVCLSKNISNIEDIIEEISKVDKDQNSPVFALKKHIELGYSIGRENAVVQVLEYAQQALEQNRTELEGADVIAEDLEAVISHVNQGLLSLNAEKLAFLKDRKVEEAPAAQNQENQDDEGSKEE